MVTLILDIDGTLTDLWPIEQTVLRTMTSQNIPSNMKETYSGDLYRIYLELVRNKVNKEAFSSHYKSTFIKLRDNLALPMPTAYPVVKFLLNNVGGYRFAYATGSSMIEAQYVLDGLGLVDMFDLTSSISSDNCVFSKKSGLAFRSFTKIHYPKLLITDQQSDIDGAKIAGIPGLLIQPNQKVTNKMIKDAFETI